MTPSYREKAKEIAKEFAEYGVNFTALFLMEPRIVEALAASYTQGLEDAAKIAEVMMPQMEGPKFIFGTDIAEKIRATMDNGGSR